MNLTASIKLYEVLSNTISFLIQPSVSRNEDGEQSYFIMAGIKI